MTLPSDMATGGRGADDERTAGDGGLVADELRRLASEIQPVDRGLRDRFLTLVAERRARVRATEAGRLSRLRKFALAASVVAGLFAASAVGVAATGGVDGVAGHVQDVLAALPVVGGDGRDSAPGPDPTAQPASDGVPQDGGPSHSGIDGSSASDTGREHADDNATDGADNAQDKGENRNTDLPDQANERSREGGPQDEGTPGPPDGAPQRGPRPR